jgi:hypothetical protein
MKRGQVAQGSFAPVGWSKGAALAADGLRVGVGQPLAVAGDQGGSVAVGERVAESGGPGDVGDALGSVAPDPRPLNPCGQQLSLESPW